MNGVIDTKERPLDAYDVIVRYNPAISRINSIKKYKEESLSSIMLSRNPFGFSSDRRGAMGATDNSVALFSSDGFSYIDPSELTINKDYAKLWKVCISKVTCEHAGEPDKNGQVKIMSTIKVLNPGQVCTDSYLIIGKFECETLANNLQQYLRTKFCRFLLLQSVSSINLSRDKFQFVPIQDFTRQWTDADLYAKYNLSQEEIDYIESVIKPM